jgi:hypothetical protein
VDVALASLYITLGHHLLGQLHFFCGHHLGLAFLRVT